MDPEGGSSGTSCRKRPDAHKKSDPIQVNRSGFRQSSNYFGDRERAAGKGGVHLNGGATARSGGEGDRGVKDLGQGRRKVRVLRGRKAKKMDWGTERRLHPL